MSNWEKRLKKLIDLTSTLEHQTWLNNELLTLKKEIQDEQQSRK
jgi:hypothetical protein